MDSALGGAWVGASVAPIEIAVGAACPEEHAVIRVTNKRKKIVCFIILVTCSLNGIQNFIREQALTRGCEMDRAVGKLTGGNEIPQVEILPILHSGVFCKLLAIGVIRPARVKEIIADVAVQSVTDEHGLVDQYCAGEDRHPGFERIEGECISKRGQAMKILGRFEVNLCPLVILRIDLVDARGCPQCAVYLETQQVGERASLVHQGPLYVGGSDQYRVVWIEGQLVTANQVPDALCIVRDDR